MKGVKEAFERTAWLREPLSDGEANTATDDPENDLSAESRESLSVLLDLPASYGGAGLQSMALAADEEFMGSFAGIAAALITF